MSGPPEVRRKDKLMPDGRMLELLATAFCGRLGTVDADGAPYVCPLLYVWKDGQVWLHNTRAEGHLQANVRCEPRACFEVDAPGQVFAYGRFQCDTSVEYASVIVFGRIAIVEDSAQKAAFFDALMAKYYGNDPTRPRGFYPRLDAVVVYALTVERMTGKETVLPAAAARWPAVDYTKSPNAVAPREP